METFKTNYRGFEITYEEDKEVWSCEVSPKKWYQKQTLKECKKAIDDFLKKEENFTRVEAYEFDRYYYTVSKITITSLTEEGDAWVKYEKGSRSKVDRNRLIKINDYNNSLMSNIKRCRDEIERLQKEVQDNIASFEKALK